MGTHTILIANPGSASRKYALYRHYTCVAHVHFEQEHRGIVCTVTHKDVSKKISTTLHDVREASRMVDDILISQDIMEPGEAIQAIGLRIVAPSSFFLRDHVVTDGVVHELERTVERAPLHIRATLDELRRLRQEFPHVKVIGLSDSAFHATKPDYAWNYGLPLADADRLDIKRFGYHGLSVASAVHELRSVDKLPPKVVLCHLGGGASVSAIYKGRGFDNSMGYSPLEGLIMATRSGSIDPTAVRELQKQLGLDSDSVEEYLNNNSGLLGLSGASSDIRELFELESQGNHQAALALASYVYVLQKSIGQMMAAMNGADMLVFTGTVGERSAIIRHRVAERLEYADFILDGHRNNTCDAPTDVTVISRDGTSKPIVVVPADEAAEMLRRVHDML